jgi:hypothetical protein
MTMVGFLFNHLVGISELGIIENDKMTPNV